LKGTLCGVLVALLAGGCAISKNGAGLAAPANAGAVVQPGFLVVGTTGSFRTIDDQHRETFYRAYVHLASERHPGEAAALNPGAFQDKVAGWTSIRTFGIPLVSRRMPVLVAAAAAQDTRFGSGDLVAARSDQDGLVWFDRVLCKAGRSFQACAEKYAPGTFDANTGRELGRDKQQKADGEWVDVSSYVRLSKDPDRHSASELDVRAINRCDDCKGALPGSVQSSVQIPKSDSR
jgi:hypothetical protein